MNLTVYCRCSWAEWMHSCSREELGENPGEGRLLATKGPEFLRI